MTIEQLERARELNIKIQHIKGVIIDLENITNVLKKYDYNGKTAIIRIEIDREYKQVPPIYVTNLVTFLDEQKTKYDKEVEELTKEFSEL